jgi:cell division protein FtsQ
MKKIRWIQSKLTRRLFATVGWIAAVALLFMAMGFAGTVQKNTICESIVIDIDVTDDRYFVEREDVLNMFRSEGVEIIGKPLSAIDLELLEEVLYSNPFVESAQVYSTISGVLQMEITQKKPVIRILSQQLGNFYLDEKGERLPLSKNYSSRVIVANGHIKNDMLGDLFLLATFVNKNQFWKSQVQQIYVAWAQEIQLIPRVGRHKILLGDVSNLDEKFDNLLNFYKYGLNNVGWDKYKSVDLRFKDQVVCKKY